ncbi:MAG: cadherin repeat domain-containing protein, partial [Hormoscilla sp. GUM202]|nr:cadherin repeat domain-containing protein [Hormoscilla sp. GUM202]
FTYQLVTGMGDTDNAAFTIVGDQLRIKSSPDFETQSSYSIRVRTTDGGLSYEENFTININGVNEGGPTDLNLSNNRIDENVADLALVGAFSTTDPDTGDTFTYQFVDGVGSADNAAFTIDGNQLRIKSSPDFETKSSYSIFVQTTDTDGLIYLKNFTININNIDEFPTDLNLSNNSIDENVAANTVVGTFSNNDPEPWFSASWRSQYYELIPYPEPWLSAPSWRRQYYELIPGTGDADNAAFRIGISQLDGDYLRIKSSPDFETQSSYSIRVQTFGYSKNLTIYINDVNENPTDLSLSNNSIDENVLALALVGTFSTTDPDTGDTSFTYQLVDGVGGTDNAAFTILGDQLQIKSSPDFETQSSYSIRVQT